MDPLSEAQGLHGAWDNIRAARPQLQMETVPAGGWTCSKQGGAVGWGAPDWEVQGREAESVGWTGAQLMTAPGLSCGQQARAKVAGEGLVAARPPLAGAPQTHSRLQALSALVGGARGQGPCQWEVGTLQLRAVRISLAGEQMQSSGATWEPCGQWRKAGPCAGPGYSGADTVVGPDKWPR